jgi:hypothetical protein
MLLSQSSVYEESRVFVRFIRIVYNLWVMKKIYLGFFIIFSLFFFLRVYHLVESLNFGTDQGLFLLDMQRIVGEKKLTLIGPTASFAASGRYIQLSSLLYYLAFPILFLSHWNVLSVSYLFIFCQFLGLVIMMYALLKKSTPFVAFVFGLLYSCLPLIVDYSRFFWNPNLLIPISSILLAFHLLLPKKKPGGYIFFIGLFWGIGLQTHLTFILAIIISFVAFLRIQKLRMTYFFLLVFGFTVGFSPLILFDVRHHFYNLDTLLFILTEKNTQHTAFGYMPHYVLSIVPFLLFGISRLLYRFYKKHVTAIHIILACFILYSFFHIIPIPEHGFTMAEGWNYAGVQKTEKLILDQVMQDRISEYNIVDILSGDTRALALRSLLTIHGYPPMAVDRYPDAKILFIYSRVPFYEIARGDLWETHALKPMKLLRSWPIANGIFLFMVTRDENI